MFETTNLHFPEIEGEGAVVERQMSLLSYVGENFIFSPDTKCNQPRIESS